MIQNDIIDALRSSEFWTDKTIIRNGIISNLICPDCEDKTAWAYQDKPFSINCNKLSNCGAHTRTLELFENIKTNIEINYPPTKNSPNKPATAYLHSRGLKRAIEGLDYEHWANIRNTQSGACMFYVSNGVWNGSIYTGGTHNTGKTANQLWKHPKYKYEYDKTLYLAEGIIDALSLIEMGYQAVALLSAGQKKEGVVGKLKNFKHIITAFDNDEAGRKATKLWGIDAILPPHKKDWNDILRYNTNDYFKKQEKTFKHFGKLAQAQTANEHAELEFEFGGSKYPAGLFEFNNQYYFAFLNKKEELVTANVSNFTMEIKHLRLSLKDVDRPENQLYVKIKPRYKKPVNALISAENMATPTALSTYILKTAFSLWKGNKEATNAFLKRITEAKTKIVRDIDITGYDTKNNAYIFPTFAITKNGTIINNNKQGFINFCGDRSVAPAAFKYFIAPSSKTNAKEIYQLIETAWGNNGTTALSWVVASWFVNQIKSKIKQFPILSLFGEAGSGKSFLTMTLKRCQCEDYEGLPMRVTNTAKGEIRKLAQRSGLFESLLEWPDNGKTRFELENILTLYNVAPLQVMAQKSNDNRTNELLFQSALMFVQNKEPFYNTQQKERVISLEFNKNFFSEETTNAYNRIFSIESSQIAGFYLSIMKNRTYFENNWYKKYINNVIDLKTLGVVNPRIAENYGLILTFHELLKNIVGFDCVCAPAGYYSEIAKQREIVCQSKDATIGSAFLHTLLDSENQHLKKDTFIKVKNGKTFINIPDARKHLSDMGKDIKANDADLYQSLRELPAYFGSDKTIRIQGKVKRVWAFTQ